MRSEIGKLILDDVFKERDTLNKKIVDSIRSAVRKWGIECMRYEIKNVQPPTRVLEAMQMQVEAERKKRAAILESEGLREAAINKATGEAQALKINAESRSMAIKTIADAMSQHVYF
uniref:Stomatin-like protein 2, mitochondrial (Trinotate prediction) n=1 Tax=Henneguya salminicola TaxID=69463 RepID=A0A6G3MG80_HENSL